MLTGTKPVERDMGLKKEPDQFAPPVLDFDTLYLYPTEAFERSAKEYEAYLKDRQNYFSAKAERERGDARDANSRASLVETESRKNEAGRIALEEQTRRDNELQSRKLKEQKAQFERTLASNKELQQKAIDAEAARKRAEATVKSVRTTAQETLASVCLCALALGCIAALGSAFFAYRSGFSHGYDKDAEARLDQLRGAKETLTSKITDLEADVKRLTPPPAPTLRAEDAEAQAQKRYEQMDAAQNEERDARLFSLFDRNFVIVTDQFTNDLASFKDSIRHDLFQEDLIHEQVTRINKPAPLPKPGENGSGDKSDANSSPNEDTKPKEETKSSLVEVIDDHTIIVPVRRTIYKWTRVRAAAPPVPTTSVPANPDPTNAAPDSSANAASDSSSGSSSAQTTPPEPGASVMEDRCVEQTYEQRDTWKRKGGHWRLAKSEVSSVSETASNQVIPPLKCRNIACGSIYVKGIEIPFTPEGKAIKTCPVCGKPLCFSESAK